MRHDLVLWQGVELRVNLGLRALLITMPIGLASRESSGRVVRVVTWHRVLVLRSSAGE